MNFELAKHYISDRLLKELSDQLFYHCFEHTMDVYESTLRLALSENINGSELDLLKTAAMFHDSGMLIRYKNHEEAGVELINKILPEFGYNSKEIDIVGKMIMTTKLPQSATTFSEKILCDADLDYLGRNDFYMISHRLRHEWYILDVKKTTLPEWYQLQVDFLGDHSYFTETAIKTRNKKKLQHLQEIRDLLCNE